MLSNNQVDEKLETYQRMNLSVRNIFHSSRTSKRYLIIKTDMFTFKTFDEPTLQQA